MKTISFLLNAIIVLMLIAITVHADANYDEEIDCLAKNIYYEARSEPPVGRHAVAWVTLNRVEHRKFPSTICKVVWQKSQFSWTHDGKSDRPYEKEHWKEALKVAEQVYRNYYEEEYLDPTNGATFYHAVYVKPKWRHSMSSSVKIGKHIFYTWDGSWK